MSYRMFVSPSNPHAIASSMTRSFSVQSHTELHPSTANEVNRIKKDILRYIGFIYPQRMLAILSMHESQFFIPAF